ncbi:MAG: uracil-DNA glycosylase [Planctomycetaceae bacterium]
MNTKRAIAQILRHLSARGVTHLPRVIPQAVPARPTAGRPGPPNRPVGGAKTGPAATLSSTSPPASGARSPGALFSKAEIDGHGVARPEAHPETITITSQSFESAQEKTEALCAVAGLVAQCKRCEQLASTRKQTVFGVGNPDARIMFIGEAPGATEDKQGEPFVGEAGQLLNKIITACKLKRDEIYICNVLRCRPPGNRTPLPQEAANCREYLDAQIHIVKPEYIVCWGSVAAQNLLNEKRPIGKLRGQFLEYRHLDQDDIKVLCTYHPSYLLRNPNAKTLVWEDMKLLMRDMGVEL